MSNVRSAAAAERELAALGNRQEAIEALERDKTALLEHYARIAPEALDSLTPEELHHLYRMLRLEVVIHPDANLEVSGVFGEGVPVSNSEFVPSYEAVVISRREPLTRKESPS
jgi:hypothetical protein